MMPCPWPIERLLPHAAPMLLLDEVLGYDEDSVVVAVTIRPDNPFATPSGVPAHVGMEMMAQACGAWVGTHRLANDEVVRLGYLLGTRQFEATRDWFSLNERLEIFARLVFQDQGMGVFECRISSCGEVLAEANLNLYQPSEDGSVPSAGT